MTDTKTVQNSKKKRTVKRSPSYPGIDLKEAIERAKKLYQEEKEHWANTDTILRHWGYDPKSGKARVVLSALIKFGLLEDADSGSKRRGRLTQLALKIVLDDRPNSIERKEAIKQAALNPAIHRDLWKEYNGSLPSDENLKYELRLHKGFSDRGVDEFVQEFRDTIKFSDLEKSSILSYDDRDRELDEEFEMPLQDGIPQGSIGKEQRPNARTVLPLPLLDGDFAYLTARFPMSQKDWDQMFAVLTAMKPGLVKDDKDIDTESDNNND